MTWRTFTKFHCDADLVVTCHAPLMSSNALRDTLNARLLDV